MKNNLQIWPLITSMIILLFIVGFVAFSKLRAQVFITPTIQASLYDQSIGAMAGYKYNNLSLALNYQQGFKYEEHSLFIKYQFNESEIFNVGVSNKVGWVNGHFGIFYPALEIQHGLFQLGFRPTNNGLLFLEPRLQIKFK